MDASEITYEMVSKKLKEIITTRGRKGTDKHEQVGGGAFGGRGECPGGGDLRRGQQVCSWWRWQPGNSSMCECGVLSTLTL